MFHYLPSNSHRPLSWCFSAFRWGSTAFSLNSHRFFTAFSVGVSLPFVLGVSCFTAVVRWRFTAFFVGISLSFVGVSLPSTLAFHCRRGPQVVGEGDDKDMQVRIESSGADDDGMTAKL